MKVEAETKVLLVFRVECFHSEDDEYLEVIADNLPELEQKATEELVKTGITTGYPRLYSAEFLIYKDKQFCLGKVADLDGRTFLWKIEYHSEYYKKLKQIKAEAKKIEDAVTRKKCDEDRLQELEDEAAEIRNRMG